ncbi:helix-turn-helix transcriptional regulator [Roseisolibacter agri]|uniref:helix-turn-helix transcriptional regulator n=1 Tax=Roseisolibacter agri TaxID=2014610 RepID=UPI0024E1220E|nr:helix-turn-helix transcriptional regulator [Roseisolibacter agri]
MLVALLPAREPSDGFAGDAVAQWHARLYDLLADGIMLFDAQGETAYRNAAAAALTDDDGHQILREARALALTVTLPVPDVGRRPAGRDAAREVTLGAIHFRLSAVMVPSSLPRASLPPLAGEPAVLVTITRTSPALPSPTVLRRRFQLTAREGSVALLLAEGRSNAGMARRLGISENTVRHYIETVLLKLDVPSRAAVAAALLGVYEHTDEHAVPRTRKPSVAD